MMIGWEPGVLGPSLRLVLGPGADEERARKTERGDERGSKKKEEEGGRATSEATAGNSSSQPSKGQRFADLQICGFAGRCYEGRSRC